MVLIRHVQKNVQTFGRKFGQKFALIALTAVVLAGCAETKLLVHTAKRLGETNKAQGGYKVGQPYQVNNVWYTPSADMSYDRTGIASWYGPNFDGKPTANGEIFDQWGVSAAHKTLPMPSLVRVTNLDNGRSLVVRINDRGPFKPGRIIDLSRRAAQLLGVEKSGTANVRVQILPKESQALARGDQGQQLSLKNSPIKATGLGSEPVAQQQLPEIASSSPRSISSPPVPADEKLQSKLYVKPRPKRDNAPIIAEKVVQEPLKNISKPSQKTPENSENTAFNAVSSPRYYIQAGAFSKASNANLVQQRLSAIADTRVTPISVAGRDLFRVRLGPFSSLAQAATFLSQVVDAGYSGARTVVDESAVN